MWDPDVPCNKLHTIPNTSGHDVCQFVRNASSCDVNQGFVNYTHFVYCSMNGIVALATILMLIWWLFVFCGMAVTANEFFCPALSTIAQSLRLSHNVAGVTFLAVGNGAADIFSSIAAIGNIKAGDAGMAIGALFGAAIAMTAVVVGTISIVCPFQSVQRPFLRDVIFSLGATYFTWYVLWDKKITRFEALGFIILYCVYVAVVLLGRFIYQRHKGRGNRIAKLANYIGEDSEESEVTRSLLSSQCSLAEENDIVYDIQMVVKEDAPDPNNLLASFVHAIKPLRTASWGSQGLYIKVYDFFKSPIRLLLCLTIPVVAERNEEVDDEGDLRKWNKPLNSLQVLTGPLCASLLTQVGFTKLGGVFPLWAVVLIVCLVLAAVVFFTSKADRRPVYHLLFAYLGFIVSIVWIYSFANEIVNVLQTFGIIFNISNAILGLTFLAWGNAMGDFISDLTMAKRGYPLMGVSACFGGPLFNILLGLGIPFTIACFKQSDDFKLEVNTEQMILAGGMAFSLIASLIIVPLSGFYMTRPYGIFLLIFYGIFLLIAILTEVDVIPNAVL